MDEKTAKEIQELRNTIGETKVLLMAAYGEIKALRTMSITFWERDGVEMNDGKSISDVLEILKTEAVDINLKKFADTDMALASKLRRRLDKLQRKNNDSSK